MIEFKDSTRENPFGSCIRYYGEIVRFFEESNRMVERFVCKIPENDKRQEIYLWNDTSTNPGMRIEFHVFLTKDNWDSITYSVKQRNDKLTFKVRRMRTGEEKKFSDEASALDCVLEFYDKILEG